MNQAELSLYTHTQLQWSAQMQHTYSVTEICSNAVYILSYCNCSNAAYILSYRDLLKCSIHAQLQMSAQMQYTYYSVTEVCSNAVYILSYSHLLKRSMHTQLQPSVQTQYTYSERSAQTQYT